MKYFLDTEFIESFHKPMFGKRRHFIDLISIGIVGADGREYSAISNEFNPKDASDWVKKNVIEKLGYRETWEHDETRDKVYTGMEAVKKAGKSNKEIAKEIIEFVMKPYFDNPLPDTNLPIFYGYYSAYDHVLLCSLFGTMMDLPAGFPMYTRDLKQMMDEWVEKAIPDLVKNHQRSFTFDEALNELESHANYPKQSNEHNAISDARWNRDLYNFLTT